jgi:hypothetical protein
MTCYSKVSLAGIPHFTTTEDVYKGYRIPENSIVVSNIWYALPRLELFPSLLSSLSLYRGIQHDEVRISSPL